MFIALDLNCVFCERSTGFPIHAAAKILFAKEPYLTGTSLVSKRSTAMKIALSIALFCLSSAAAFAGVEQLNPDDYQVFVARWSPSSAPLCAVIETADAWSQLLHPAAVMWSNKAFAPPADFWNDHAVLLFARIVNGGSDTKTIFHLDGVKTTQDAIDVDEHFTPPPAASYKINWYLAVAVNKPLAAHVHFVENGAPVCTLDRADGQWTSAALPSK